MRTLSTIIYFLGIASLLWYSPPILRDALAKTAVGSQKIQIFDSVANKVIEVDKIVKSNKGIN